LERLLEKSAEQLEINPCAVGIAGVTDARAVSQVASIVQLKPNSDRKPNRRLDVDQITAAKEPVYPDLL